jgi:SAM-dependent methyltransferase
MNEWNMERWKYYDITHKRHLICNPTSEEKLNELAKLLAVEPGMSVLDIACGKAELLVRLVESYGVRGVGVDKSPYTIQDAIRKKNERVPDASLEFLEMDGADYQPDAPEFFDAAMCLGATWIWGGYRGTLDALEEFVKPGGFVAVGEPHWVHEPLQQYLEHEGLNEGDFSTHYGNALIGEEVGLELVYTLVSNLDDWDRYETLQWYAVDEYARANPNDPDLPEIIRRSKRSRESYLRWGRDTLGWAIYLFRKPA